MRAIIDTSGDPLTQIAMGRAITQLYVEGDILDTMPELHMSHVPGVMTFSEPCWGGLKVDTVDGLDKGLINYADAEPSRRRARYICSHIAIAAYSDKIKRKFLRKQKLKKAPTVPFTDEHIAKFDIKPSIREKIVDAKEHVLYDYFVFFKDQVTSCDLARDGGEQLVCCRDYLNELLRWSYFDATSPFELGIT
jgi:hypothetical protein